MKTLAAIVLGLCSATACAGGDTETDPSPIWQTVCTLFDQGYTEAEAVDQMTATAAGIGIPYPAAVGRQAVDTAITDC